MSLFPNWTQTIFRNPESCSLCEFVTLIFLHIENIRGEVKSCGEINGKGHCGKISVAETRAPQTRLSCCLTFKHCSLRVSFTTELQRVA